MPDTSLPPDDDAPAISPQRLRVRALMLLALMAALLVGGVLYLLYVRGAFEPTQPLFLKCENSEGITTGMDMTFSGFPIGRVRRIRMGRDGQALVRVDIKQTHAHLLRESTIFLLETNVVGAAKLRAVTSQLDDPLLPPGSRRPLLRGDLAAELPRILAEASALMNNLVQLTSGESALSQALEDVHRLTERISTPVKGGLLGAITGNPRDGQRLSRLLENADALVLNLNALAKNANTQVLGPKGLTSDAQTALRQVQKMLDELRESLKKLDAILGDAKNITGNVEGATTDLQDLRDEVDANLQRAETLMNSLSRRWPFASGKQELKLP